LQVYAEAAQRLRTIPGVEKRTAEVVVEEIGTDMGQFAKAGHLTSWAGRSPGNNESAGKRRSSQTTKESRWLCQVLTIQFGTGDVVQCGTPAQGGDSSVSQTRELRSYSEGYRAGGMI
jgi:hypothetical protein